MTLTRNFAFLVCAMGLSLTLTAPSQAATPSNAPSSLSSLIDRIEAAANQQNLEQVLDFYSPNFVTDDGVTYDTVKQGLSQLWERYPNLNYTINLTAWEQKDNQWIADTVTTIKGSNTIKGREMTLESTLTSRQYFQDGQLIRQEISQERTDITTGETPPNVEINLPDTIKVGQTFDFDVILREPLGDNLLAGTAIEEIAQADSYLAPSQFELQLLQSGGIFKRATAPNTPESHWLSALLVQPDGLRLITQRLLIEK